MKICHYREDTKEFITEREARPNPLEKGKFLIPRNATDAPPPEAGENEKAVFDSTTKKWSVVPDYRRTTKYDFRTPVIFGLGETPDPGLLDVPAPETTAELANKAIEGKISKQMRAEAIKTLKARGAIPDDY